MDIDTLEDLPFESLLLIAYELPIYTVNDLCFVSKKFERSICSSEVFWRNKYIKEYGEPSYPYEGSWKELYYNSPNLWMDRSFHMVNFTVKQAEIGREYNLLIDKDNIIWQRRNHESEFTKVAKEQYPRVKYFKGKNISCGEKHCAFIDHHDRVWTKGDNRHGLGHDSGVSNWNRVPILEAIQVACGSYYSAIISRYNDIYVFGKNDHGQLGIKAKHKYMNVPKRLKNFKAKYISCGDNHTAFIDLDNNVFTFGNIGLSVSKENIYHPQQLIGVKAKQISCGYHTMGFIDDQDHVWMFGYNDKGQLGLGDRNNRREPTKIEGIKARQIKCGFEITTIVDLDYNLWVCGDNTILDLLFGETEWRPNILNKINGISIRHVSSSPYSYNLTAIGHRLY